MSTVVSIDKALAKMQAMANILDRPIKDVLDSAARLIAIEFAKTSQPFGTGADARDLGMSAVARDIYRVYATPNQAYKDISNNSAQSAFWAAYKSGEFDRAEDILIRFGGDLRAALFASFDGGSAHRSLQNKTTGRIPPSTSPDTIVTNPDALRRYVEKIQGDVGKGKGAWADVARQISGSIRGLRQEGDITANWITRKSSGMGRVSRSGTDAYPVILIGSSVPYADHILSGGALARAKAIGRERMLENLRHAIDAEARKLRHAA